VDHDLAEATLLRAAGMPIPSAASGREASEDLPDVLFLEHAARMRRVAMRKFGIPAEAVDELVQDVFVTYLVNPPRVHDLRKYLIGGICNASRKYWAKRAGENRLFVNADVQEDIGPVSEDLFEGLSVRLLVGATLARLSQRCREALRLSYLGECSTVMAEVLSTTASNANYLVHVCRKRAKKIYDEIRQVR
jgi:RNA polymerase sigma factor (sigma-70 family)